MRAFAADFQPLKGCVLNFSFHFDGAKMNGSTVKKNKGGLGGRKALNDIQVFTVSNSAKPSALQPLRKQNQKNVITIGEDVGVGVVKKQLVKAQASGRKALGDLTNTVKPFGQQQGLKNKSQVKQSLTMAEDVPYCIAEEGFRHNHWLGNCLTWLIHMANFKH